MLEHSPVSLRLARSARSNWTGTVNLVEIYAQALGAEE